MNSEAQETSPKVGRPSGYSQEIADRICAELADGKSLRSICKADDMPSSVTVYSWLRIFPEFLKQYTRSKEDAADAFAEDILDIADEATNDWMAVNDPDNPGYRYNGEAVNRSRLRVDARKWVAARLKPKKYGDRVSTELTGADGKDLIPAVDNKDLARRIAFVLQQGVQQ